MIIGGIILIALIWWAFAHDAAESEEKRADAFDAVKRANKWIKEYNQEIINLKDLIDEGCHDNDKINQMIDYEKHKIKQEEAIIEEYRLAGYPTEKWRK